MKRGGGFSGGVAAGRGGGLRRGRFGNGAREALWALPVNRCTPIAFYKRTVFRELGLVPPRAWDELRDVARRATTRERWGFACPIDWWFWVALVGQAGGTLVE